MTKAPLDDSLLPADNTLAWCRQACARLLQPVVRLALRFGLKHADLDEILRQELVREAAAQVPPKGAQGKPNISQLAVLTGLQRREIGERLAQGEEAAIVVTDRSWPSRVFTAWLRWVAENPLLRTLPTGASGDAPGFPSFANLSRQVTRGNVHHRTVLNELLRLGLVEEGAQTVTLLEANFTPREDQRLMLSFAGDNGRDHLHAIIANVSGQQPPFLEQAVFASGISAEDCAAAQALARTHWQQLHQSLVGYLTEAETRAPAAGEAPRQRLRAGVYVYYEPDVRDDEPPH